MEQALTPIFEAQEPQSSLTQDSPSTTLNFSWTPASSGTLTLKAVASVSADGGTDSIELDSFTCEELTVNEPDNTELVLSNLSTHYYSIESGNADPEAYGVRYCQALSEDSKILVIRNLDWFISGGYITGYCSDKNAVITAEGRGLGAGSYAVTQQPRADVDGTGKFEINLDSDSSIEKQAKYSSFMFYITATNEATEQQTEYTVIVDNTKSDTNANNPATYLAVLDDEQKVPLSADLEITDMDGNGSKSFGEITTDIGLISVQVERKSEKVKNESKWMAADLNYVSLNGGTPIQFDTRRAGSPDTTSQALALERGINILQVSCRMDTPDMKAFTSSNSASCGLKISTTVEKEAHAYQKFIFIINYTGSKPDIISDTQTSTAIKSITVSQYTSNTSVAQNDYIGITSSGGTSHKIVVPTTLHQWPSYKNSAPDKSLEDIKHETVILGIHTADPAATVKIVDAPYTAANGKIISMIDTNTTDKTLS